jgi:type I restriction enzyme, S subunit
MMPTEVFKTFDEYMPADITWCPEIPSHWNTAPLRMLFDESRRKNRDRKVQDYLSLMAGVGVIPYAEKGDVGNKMPEDLANCKIVAPDDFVLNSMNFGIGSFGRSKFYGVCSSVYVILKARDVSQLSFFERVFQHPQFQRFSQSLGNGILAHRCAIGWDELKNAHFPVPPADEIAAIAAFLDDKCAKIDEAVKIKEDQIALLRERRQILIERAVTRGLNPVAPMKDSGIDWVGKIPEHWDLKRAKFLFREINDRSEDGAEELLSVSHTTGVTSRSEKNINMFMADDYTGSKLCRPGDLVFNTMWAWMGALGVSDVCGIVSPSYGVYRQIKKDSFNSKYLEWLLRCSSYVEHYNKVSTGLHSSRLRFYAHMFFDMFLGFPPKAEQDEIVAQAEKNSVQIEAGINIKERQIAALKEYKTSLINAAVTGKIKVF